MRKYIYAIFWAFLIALSDGMGSEDYETPSKRRKIDRADEKSEASITIDMDVIPFSAQEMENLKLALKSMNADGDYAIPTTDSGFKHLLSLEEGNEQTVISFLNTFVPTFENDHVTSVKSASLALPVLAQAGYKQTFMDFHIVSEKGDHYIIEMQAQRHIYFDERALFYACSTYRNQIEEKAFKDSSWYKELKPVIAIQVLDYDTNRVKGIKDSKIEDTLPKRTHEHPLPEGKFIKHFLMTCRVSQQMLNHLQMIQVELGRVKDVLFPPKQSFTELDWWLSVFKFAGRYTQNYIAGLEKEGIIMPDPIKQAFTRLQYSKWSPKDIREYKEDITNRERNSIFLAVERAEGRAEGREEGRAEGREEGREEGRQEGRAEGRAEGREEGRQEEKTDLAKKMLEQGIHSDTVRSIAQLSDEQIQLLMKEIQETKEKNS